MLPMEHLLSHPQVLQSLDLYSNLMQSRRQTYLKHILCKESSTINYHHMQKEFYITKLFPCPQEVTQRKKSVLTSL